MKELRHNMRLIGFAVVFALVFLSTWFALTVFEQGAIWASNSYNSRLSSTSTQRGDIFDRNNALLATTRNQQRIYIEDESIRRALVATVGDTAGMSGASIESRFASELLDLDGSLFERLNALSNDTQRTGSSFSLTIDARLTMSIAAAFPKNYRGAVCVMNYRTGEILAMISRPDYDPYVAGQPDANVEDSAYLNRCLQGLYTPGSVFKIVTLAAALENDPNVIDQTFTCSGVWEYEGGSIVCANHTAHGNIDLKTAFARSCNVIFGKLAYQLGLSRLEETAERLGFNENFKFDDFSIYNSQFPTKTQNMSGLVWAGIGQGTVLVTPLHMAMITSSVANDGVMMRPWLVRQIATSTGTITYTGTSKSYRRTMSVDAAALISEYMYNTVQSGTATRAQIDGYTICGKTGSAQISDDKTVETNSWYTGFVDDPDHPYAIAVVIEQGGAGSGLASELAATSLELAILMVN